jgi:hypothetical protein
MFREPTNSMTILAGCAIAAMLAGAGRWILASIVIAVAFTYVLWANRPINS